MIRYTIDPDAKTAKPADAAAPTKAAEDQPKAPAKPRKVATKRPAEPDDAKTLL